MHKKVIIIGAGGHAKVIADIIEKSGDEVVGFLDDKMDYTDAFANLALSISSVVLNTSVLILLLVRSYSLIISSSVVFGFGFA